jgi:hypothetical protein
VTVDPRSAPESGQTSVKSAFTRPAWPTPETALGFAGLPRSSPYDRSALGAPGLARLLVRHRTYRRGEWRTRVTTSNSRGYDERAAGPLRSTRDVGQKCAPDCARDHDTTTDFHGRCRTARRQNPLVTLRITEGLADVSAISPRNHQSLPSTPLGRLQTRPKGPSAAGWRQVSNRLEALLR